MNKSEKLLILGAGQHGRVVREIAAQSDCFTKIEFLDDAAEDAVGKLDVYESLVGDFPYAFVAFGNNSLRRQWIEKIKDAGYILPVIVHPAAVISPTAQLRDNVVVCANAVVDTESVVSQGGIVSIGALVGHHCFIGDACHIAVGAVVPNNSLVLAETKVEAGQVYRQTENR